MMDRIRRLIRHEDEGYPPMGGSDPEPEPIKTGRWVCEHKPSCPDRVKIMVVNTTWNIQEISGRVLESYTPGHGTMASCLECFAPAEWVEDELEPAEE